MGSIFSLCCGAGWREREPGFEQDNVDGVKFVTDKALTNEGTYKLASFVYVLFLCYCIFRF